MSEINIDKGELEEKLIRVFCEVFGVGNFTGDTPMHEMRAVAEMAGSMFGRALAASLHEGPVGADIAFAIRAYEQLGKERFLKTISRIGGPGGQLRERWSSKD